MPCGEMYESKGVSLMYAYLQTGKDVYLPNTYRNWIIYWGEMQRVSVM